MDLFVAHLCHTCHNLMDSYQNGNDIERSAEFLMLILLTQKRLIETGEIEIEIKE